MTTLSSTPGRPATACDGASVGVLIEQGGLLLVGDRTDGAGVAPPAGHVFDAHDGYADAAVAEVREELGLAVTDLELVTGGWRPNRCKRGDGPHGPGHHWQIYRAHTTGDLAVDAGSFAGVRWLGGGELLALARRTLAHAHGSLTAAAWTDLPGIEPVWVRWLVAADLISLSGHALQAIETHLQHDIGRTGRTGRDGTP